ncbi:MAG: potassium channel protein [Acidobacteria bacterium]|nr:potassium channel protein [Acidobacteriota bacterium]MCA1637560.1 potassium channel protein [Acidobacteriota bacterium]
MNFLPTLSKITRRRLGFATLTIIAMIAFGSIAFYLLEDISMLDSVYLATQTVTTVGYGDIALRTRGGKMFAVVFMLFGVGTVLYALTVLAQAVIQSEIVEALGLRRKTREMERLENHYIVCGAGRVGRRIIRNLQKQNLPFVIIEKDAKKVASFEEDGAIILIADATFEETLNQAGVKRARGLATCLADDAANVYVVLTARDLNENLHIVARAVEEQAEPKLIRAGANRVVAPTIIGSQSMARALLKPTIADFMDSIVAESFDLVFDEVVVKANSPYIDKELKNTNISGELNLLIVAIRRKGGEMIFQPSADTCIRDGDLLIVIGKAEAMQKLINASK